MLYKTNYAGVYLINNC